MSELDLFYAEQQQIMKMAEEDFADYLMRRGQRRRYGQCDPQDLGL